MHWTVTVVLKFAESMDSVDDECGYMESLDYWNYIGMLMVKDILIMLQSDAFDPQRITFCFCDIDLSADFTMCCYRIFIVQSDHISTSLVFKQCC